MLCAVCMPEFGASELAAIEALRHAHDPDKARRIGPHVTLVFPTQALPEADLIRHVGAAAAAFGKTALCFRSTLPYREPATGRSFLFLVPDEGFGWLIRLHQRLHSGPLREALQPDRPYIPHITLGEFDGFAQARELSERENSKAQLFAGRVTTIDILRIEPDRVQRVHCEPLRDDPP